MEEEGGNDAEKRGEFEEGENQRREEIMMTRGNKHDHKRESTVRGKVRKDKSTSRRREKMTTRRGTDIARDFAFYQCISCIIYIPKEGYSLLENKL